MVTIVSRSSQPRYHTDTVDFLIGNVGDWFETTVEVEAEISIEATSNNMIKLNDSGTIVLMNGDNWDDYGVEVGDTIYYAYDYINQANGVATNNSGSFTVSSINGDTLTPSASIQSTGTNITFVGSAFVQSGNNYMTNTLTFTVDKDWTALEFKYNQLINSNYQTPTFDSFIDGNENRFYASGLDATDTVTVVTLNQTGLKSGGVIDSATIIGNGKSSGVSSFIITFVHQIWGVYDNINQILLGNSPDWYLGSECVTDNMFFKFWKTAGDPNITVENNITNPTTKKIGNTGWLDENYNGNANIYSLTNYAVTDLSSNPLDDLSSYDDCRVSFDIEGTGFTSATDLMFTLLTLPVTITEIQNKTLDHLSLLTGNSFDCENGSTYPQGTYSSTINGHTNSGGEQVDIDNIDVVVNSSTSITVTIDVSPNTAFGTYINNRGANDRNYILLVSVGDINGVTLTSDRVTLYHNGVWEISPIETQDLKATLDFYPWDLDGYTTPGTSVSNPEMTQEADFHTKIDFDVDTSTTVIESIQFGIELHQISTDDVITVFDSFNVDVSSFPIDNNNIQQIDVDTYRQFNYGNTFKDNRIYIQRDSASDSGTNRAYSCLVPFRARWEWWIANNNTPSLFSSSFPLNNLNEQWYPKQAVADLEVRAYILLTTTEGTDTIYYKTAEEFTIYDYLNDARYTHSIGIYLDSGFSSSLATGNTQTTGNYTRDIYVIDENNDNYVQATLVKGTADFSGHEYGEICIEVLEGSGWVTMWKLRSDQTTVDPSSPLQPLSGETTVKTTIATGSVTLQCVIDPTLLPNDIEYKISANYKGSSDDGTVTNYYERDFIIGKIVSLSTEEPDEDREFGECSYETLVVGHLTDTDSYKNDIKALRYDRGDESFSIALYLVDSNGTEYALNTNLYGIFYDFGDLTDYPDTIYYQLHWRLVLAERGAGKYRIKRVVTEFGTDTEYYSKCYKLLPYTQQNVEGTIRIESVMNGLLQETGVDYKGLNVLDHLRIDGFFGKRKPKYEEESSIDINYNQTQIIQDLISTYELKTKLVPDCITNSIIDYHLRANKLFISDYNSDNHSYDFKSFPVHLTSVDAPIYPNNNKNASLRIEFNERKLIKRKSNCGERSIDPISVSYVGADYCTRDIFVKGYWDYGEDETPVFTFSEDATYNSFSNDGSSGTVTYSINGGTYTNTTPFTVSASDTIQFKRTITTAYGYAIISGNYA